MPPKSGMNLWSTFISPAGSCGYLPDRVWQLHYEVAGSLVQLSLPADSSLGYAERMVA